MTWKSTKLFAREAGVTQQTIVNWIKQNKYDRVKQTEGGHYRIWTENSPKIYLYARVSSKKQQSSLDNQIQILKENKDFGEAEVVSDIGSGFNFKRSGFKRILESALSGTPTTVVVTTHDRLCRSAFPLIEYIIKLHGGRIILLEEDDQTDQFDVSILIAFLTSFCNSRYGKRSAYRSRVKKNKNISK